MSVAINDERTLLLIKPDGVLRGLCGRIIARLEDAGLAVVGLKMVQVGKEQAQRHYMDDPQWVANLGHKTLRTYAKHGRDPVAELGTDDPATIGGYIRGWLIDYITSGPTVACVLQGAHAVELVRKLSGDTMPIDAAPGTIRGDFSSVSAIAANTLHTAVKNVVHSSSDVDEARREIAEWFSPAEICVHRPVSWSAIY
ncbi:MAG: nucleoside-diphosphate kinase [Bacillota bacterium]|nr:nucleoside-diphosphate kinase [Bacillota bacterium]